MTARRRARKSILAPLKSSDIMNEKILNQLFERAVSKGSYFLEVLANVHTDNPSPLTMADRFDGKPALALPPARMTEYDSTIKLRVARKFSWGWGWFVRVEI